MTVRNMRANGVRSPDVSQCHHRTMLSADPWPDHVPMPAFGPGSPKPKHGSQKLP
jgi:hypothetical protein